MKRQKLLIVTSLVMIIYGIAILVGFLLSTYKPDLYEMYKDLALLIIATPAAYLAYSFQKRTEFVKTLRDLWLHMIEAVQMSVEYTYNPNPSSELGKILTKLSLSIDEVRGVFKNVDEEDGKGGLYPFESLKIIRKEMVKLGSKTASSDEQAHTQAREKILKEWRELRSKFLLELDRDFPTYPNSPYLIEPKE
jgi:hypothetical protein